MHRQVFGYCQACRGAWVLGMAAGVVCLAVVVCFAQDNLPDVVVKNRPDPAKRLSAVRAELEPALEDMRQREKDAQRYRHDIVYTNAPIGVLYREVRGLERVIREKRKALEDEISKDPGYRELQRKNIEARKRVSKLRDLERMYLERETKRKAGRR
jgi:hypothetical protein